MALDIFNTKKNIIRTIPGTETPGSKLANSVLPQANIPQPFVPSTPRPTTVPTPVGVPTATQQAPASFGSYKRVPIQSGTDAQVLAQMQAIDRQQAPEPPSVDKFLESGSFPSSVLSSPTTPTSLDVLLEQRANDRKALLGTFARTPEEQQILQQRANANEALNAAILTVNKGLVGLKGEPISAGAISGRQKALSEETALGIETLQNEVSRLDDALGIAKADSKSKQDTYKTLLGFTEDDIARIDKQTADYNTELEKLSDNARAVVNNAISTYGSGGISKLSQEDKIYLAQQAEIGGVPLGFILDGIATVNEETQARIALNNAFSQNMQNANLKLSEDRLALSLYDSTKLSKDERTASFMNELANPQNPNYIPKDSNRADVEMYAVSQGINPYTEEMQNVLDKIGFKKSSGDGFWSSIGKFLSNTAVGTEEPVQ